jgi:predicted secreted protein with PEFG-CTERM motif
MKAQSVQTQRNINTNGTSTSSNTNGTSTPSSIVGSSTGVVVGKVISYMHEASDGTAVIVRTGHPLSGQVLDIAIGFKDADNNFVAHQNYAITVLQDGKTVFSNSAGHTHTGTDSVTTDALSSNDPVDITVTLNGVGLPTADPSTWTGAKGEAIVFSQATDIKTPTTMTNSTMTSSNMTMTNSTTEQAGNATVPEFGPVASIVLAIAVLSIVVFAAKTRVIPRL